MIQWYTGNAVTVLAGLPEQSVHLAVTSQPYYGAVRNYAQETAVDWPLVSYRPMTGLPLLEVPAWSGQLGHEPTIEAFVAHSVLVYRSLRRVLRPDGVFFLNIGDCYSGSGKGPMGKTSDFQGKDRVSHTVDSQFNPARDVLIPGLRRKDLAGVPWRLALALQADGWLLRDEIIWHKQPGMPESVVDRTTRQHEQVFMFTLSPRYYYDWVAISIPLKGATVERYQYGRNAGNKAASTPTQQAVHTLAKPTESYADAPGLARRRSVWPISNPGYSGAHYAVMPPALARDCILAGSPTRCCPQCGTGWRRIVEQVGEYQNNRSKSSRKQITVQHATSKLLTRGVNTLYQSAGWQAGCRCENNDGSEQAVVIDPFSGSGTVQLEAERHGRSSVYIDADPASLVLAAARLSDEYYSLMPMFAPVEVLPSLTRLSGVGSGNQAALAAKEVDNDR